MYEPHNTCTGLELHQVEVYKTWTKSNAFLWTVSGLRWPVLIAIEENRSRGKKAEEVETAVCSSSRACSLLVASKETS